MCQPATGKDATIHLSLCRRGASVFHNWFLPLYDSVDLYTAVARPGKPCGRGAYRDMEEAGGAIADCLANLFDDDVPYVFFGHSMGAAAGLPGRLPSCARVGGRSPVG
ncbi:thioesterase domain-containing protein [Pseudomonas aeruginosa]